MPSIQDTRQTGINPNFGCALVSPRARGRTRLIEVTTGLSVEERRAQWRTENEIRPAQQAGAQCDGGCYRSHSQSLCAGIHAAMQPQAQGASALGLKRDARGYLKFEGWRLNAPASYRAEPKREAWLSPGLLSQPATLSRSICPNGAAAASTRCRRKRRPDLPLCPAGQEARLG
jgi:hypothetical protein